MTTPTPVPMFDSREDLAKQIEAQSAGWHRIGKALSNFLSTAFPQAKVEAEELGLSVIALMTTGDEVQIKRLLQPPPPFSMYGPNPTAVLARLVEDRDRLQTQIDLAERGLDSLRGSSKKNDGVADLLEAGTLGPLRGMLAQIEEQISNIQSSMESES